MPALRLFGARWHASSDALPLLGAVLTAFNLVWTVIFVFFIIFFSKPKHCEGPNRIQHYLVVWGTLGLFIASLFLALAMVGAGLPGTPFEPSKRWLVAPVLYIQATKWILLLGWLPFAIWAVYSSPSGCWTSGRRTETEIVLWAAAGTVLAMFALVVLTFNLMSRYDPQERWQRRLQRISKVLGCYTVLKSAQLDDTEEGDGAALQQIAGSFARFFGQIDVENSDVLAGFVLAEVLQVHQRKALIARELQRHGLVCCDQALPQRPLAEETDRPGAQPAEVKGSKGSSKQSGSRAGAGSGSGLGSDGVTEPGTPRQESELKRDSAQRNGSSGGDSAGRGSGIAAAGSGGGGGGGSTQQVSSYIDAQCGNSGEDEEGSGGAASMLHQAGEPAASPAGEREQPDGTASSAHELQPEESGQQAEHTQQGEGEGQHVSLELDSPLFDWMRDISRGNNFALTPSKWGAKLAPALPPQRSTELYTGSCDYVRREDLEEARHWARFAVAAYGSPAWTWTSDKTWTNWAQPSHWRARLQIWRWTHPQRKVVEGPLPPVQQKLKDRKEYVAHYVGARQVAGVLDEDFVYMSFANKALGSTPYIILLDRPRRTVVLAIRGSQSYSDLITDLMDRPVDISDWVPQDLKQEQGLDEPIKAHTGMFSAAKAILQDLNEHQILPILLTGQPLSQEEREREHAAHAADARDEQAGSYRRRSARGAPSGRTGGGSSREGADAGDGDPSAAAKTAPSGEEGTGEADEQLPGVEELQGPEQPRSGWLRWLSQPLWGAPVAGGAAAPCQQAPDSGLWQSSLMQRLSQPRSVALRLSQPLWGPFQAPPTPAVFAAYAEALQPLQAQQGGQPSDPSPTATSAEEAGGEPRPARGGDGGSGSAPAARARADSAAQRAAEAGPSMEEQLGCEDYQRMLQERGLDCRGWSLVVTGHSLGAAVAALVGMQFRSWCPDVRVWSFNPPGGMATRNLSAALRGFVTSVVVGKDIISRTGTVTFERMLDQMVVALARTRLCKLRVLLQARSRSLRRKPAGAIFHPVEDIPTEVLEYVRGYFESKCRYRSLFVPMFPAGRMLQLRRLKGAGGEESWDAVWIAAEQIMEEGILLSSHQTSDHSTALLTRVLDQLVGAEGKNKA